MMKQLLPFVCLVVNQFVAIDGHFEPLQSPMKGFVIESRMGETYLLSIGNNMIRVNQNHLQSCEPSPLLGYKFDDEVNTFPNQCPFPEVPPLIERNFKNISVESGEKIRFDVLYTGSPKPVVSFFKNGHRLVTNHRIQVLDNLMIEKSSVEDNGVYTMIAQNSLGTDRIDFVLTVTPLSVNTPAPNKCPPKVDAFSDSLIIFNDSVQLAWKAVDLDDVKYRVELYDNKTSQWRTLATVPENSIVVKKLRCFLWYRFRVTAIANGCESPPLDSKHVMVQYGVPEAIPNPLTISEMANDRMTIVWQPPSRDCGSPIFEYVIEKQYHNTTEWKPIGKTAANLRQMTDKNIDGVFRYGIKAVNAFGESIGFHSTYITPSHMNKVQCPQKPQGLLEVFDITRDSVQMKWDQCLRDLDANYTFQVETEEYGSKHWELVGNTNISQISVNHLKCYTEYRFRVTVLITGCETVVLESNPIQTLGTPETPYGPIRINVLDANKLIIYWSSPPVVCDAPIEGYVIEKQYNTSTEWVFVSKATGSELQDDNIGETYRYKISAINKYGESIPLISELMTPSDLVPKPKCPEKPHGVIEVTSVARNSVNLLWDHCIPDKGLEPIKRDVFQLEMIEVKTGARNVVGNTTDYESAVNQLKCHTEYKFIVKVFTPECETVALESGLIRTSGQPEVPLRPISVAVHDPTKLTLSWTTPPVVCNAPIEEYIVEKQYNSSEKWVFMGKTETNSLEDLNIGNTYRFKIIAVNRYGESEPLLSKFVTPHEMLPKPDCPKKPGGEVELVAVHRDSVHLWWGKNLIDKDGTYSFEIELSQLNTGVWKPVGQTAAHQTLVNQLKCVTEYIFRVKVFTPDCETVILNTRSVTTPGTADAPPKPISVIVYGPDRLNMSWTPVPPVCGVPLDGYIIDKQYENQVAWINVGTTVGNRFTDLNVGRTFRYRIRSINRYGLSPPLISKHITPYEMWKIANR